MANTTEKGGTAAKRQAKKIESVEDITVLEELQEKGQETALQIDQDGRETRTNILRRIRDGVLSVDSTIRGRPEDEMEYNARNIFAMASLVSVLALGSTALDVATAGITSPGWPLSTIAEILSDRGIEFVAEEAGEMTINAARRLQGKEPKEEQVITPTARLLATGLNLIPGVNEISNAVLTQAVIQSLEAPPIAGAFAERMRRTTDTILNWFGNRGEDNQRAREIHESLGQQSPEANTSFIAEFIDRTVNPQPQPA
jgi:hypothetical protein